jgi:hypothetical protein
MGIPVAQRTPIASLIDLGALERARGRALTPAELRAALPRGWVPDESDPTLARRDARVFFRDSGVLVAALLSFGSLGLFFLWSAMPRGWSGIARLGLLIGVVVLAGGLVAPIVTRALQRRG